MIRHESLAGFVGVAVSDRLLVEVGADSVAVDHEAQGRPQRAGVDPNPAEATPEHARHAVEPESFLSDDAGTDVADARDGQLPGVEADHGRRRPASASQSAVQRVESTAEVGGLRIQGLEQLLGVLGLGRGRGPVPEDIHYREQQAARTTTDPREVPRGAFSREGETKMGDGGTHSFISKVTVVPWGPVEISK